MRCKKCKKRIKKYFSFCPYCGFDVNGELDNTKKPLKAQDVFAGISYGFGTGSWWMSALLLVFCVFRTFNVVMVQSAASHGDFETLCTSLDAMFMFTDLIKIIGLPLLMHFVSIIIGIVFGLIGKTSTRYPKKARKGKNRSIMALISSLFGMLLPLFIIILLTLVLAVIKALFAGL